VNGFCFDSEKICLGGTGLIIKPKNLSQNHYQRVNSFFPQGCFCTSTDGRFVQNAVSGFLKSRQVQQFKDLLPFRAVRAASAGSTKRNCVGQKGCISFKQVCEQPQCLAGCLPHLKNCENQIYTDGKFWDFFKPGNSLKRNENRMKTK